LYAGVAMILISVFTASIALLVFGVFCIFEFYLSWCPVCSALNRNTCENP